MVNLLSVTIIEMKKENIPVFIVTVGQLLYHCLIKRFEPPWE